MTDADGKFVPLALEDNGMPDRFPVQRAAWWRDASGLHDIVGIYAVGSAHSFRAVQEKHHLLRRAWRADAGSAEHRAAYDALAVELERLGHWKRADG